MNITDRKYITVEKSIYFNPEGEEVKGKIYLKSKYNKNLIPKIKSIPRNWWEFKNKQWVIPFTDSNLETIHKLGFTHFEAEKKEEPLNAYVYKKYIKLTKENRQKMSNSYWSNIGIRINIKDSDWLLPNTEFVIDILQNEFKYNIIHVKEAESINKWEDIELSENIINYTSRTGKQFYPFQLDAIKFLIFKQGKGLIGDDMGIGKTIEVLGYLLAKPEIRPVLIICKSTAKLNWLIEVQEWLPNELCYLLKGTKDEDLLTCLFKLYVINYDILNSRLDQIINIIKPKLIIADECQAVKNITAQRTIAFTELCTGTTNEIRNNNFLIDRNKLQTIPMSGTPITNRPSEFFTVLNILDKNSFPSWTHYKTRYCFKSDSYYNKKLKKERMLELNSDVKKLMIRRRKEDVLKDLPPKIRTIIPIEINNRKEYDLAQRFFLDWMLKTYGQIATKKAAKAEEICFINRMKMLTAQGKLENMLKWAEDFLESDRKLIIFCNHTFVIDAIIAKFGDICVKIVGGMSEEHKQYAKEQFQTNNKIRVFAGNLKAAGDSITLTASSDVAFFEMAWTPGAHIQGEDRAHRNGQLDTVNVNYLIAKKTIEDYLIAAINTKMKTLNQVLDGKPCDEEDDLDMLDKVMEIYMSELAIGGRYV